VEVGEEAGDDVSPTSMRLRTRKRRENLRASGGGYGEESPTGGVNVSAAVIEDSDSDSEC
jgi:hypothetical protein